MRTALDVAPSRPSTAANELTGALSLSAAASAIWDAVVIGAGPAGSLTAHELARAGARVLLVDKCAFPRAKVCGCCLNADAIATLRAQRLGHVLDVLGAVPLRALVVSAGRARATLPLEGALALSREALDAGLIRAAIAADAAFLPRTRATVLKSQQDVVGVRLEHAEGSEDPVVTRAARVVVADGLAGTALALRPEFAPQPRRASRFGAATILADAPHEYEPGIIYMAAGAGGYVGTVRLEDGRLNLAAALDPAMVRADGGPGASIARLLAGARMPPIPHLADARWHGTPTLTRARPILERDAILLIGDAAGYVEPFTGEGMAWALASAVAAADILTAERASPSATAPGRWSRAHARRIAPRQRTCRTIAWLLRRPRLTTLVIRALHACPRLADPLLRRVHSLPSGIPYRRTSP